MANYKLPTTITDEYTHMQDFAWKKCPHTKQQFINEYWPESQAALSCIGPDLSESRIPGQQASGLYNHALLSLEVAARSVTAIRDKSIECKAWIDGEPDARDPDYTFPFCRAVWRYAFTAYIGYIISNYSVFRPGSPFTWRPLLHDIHDFVPRSQTALVPSNRRLAPRPISLMTFARLYSNSPDYNLTIAAVADAFSESPSHDNPIAWAFTRTLGLLDKHLRNSTLPYWWVDVFNDYRRHQDDYVPIKYNADGVDIGFRISKSPQAILEFLSDCISSGKLIVNRKGATFHILERSLYMVVPAGWERLAALFDHPSFNAVALQKLFKTHGFVVNDPVTDELVSSWLIKPPHSNTVAGQAKCILFSDEATNIVYPGGIQQSDNPDFLRSESLVSSN